MLKRFFDWLSEGAIPQSENNYLDIFSEDYRIF
jgi:hypothetical protein